jgi:hypothetical protein
MKRFRHSAVAVFNFLRENVQNLPVVRVPSIIAMPFLKVLVVQATNSVPVNNCQAQVQLARKKDCRELA